jgi:C4-dicarboxylate transporter/malic acid transport protein
VAVLAPAPPRIAAPVVGPNWFAVVMGTGIVATAATLLPRRLPGLDALAAAAWLAAAVLLLLLALAAAAHWIADPARAREHVLAPAMLPFLGAPPIAIMVVGAGALATHDAVALAATLWLIGTVAGLVVAAFVPFRMITRDPGEASGGWLMPVVGPLVSAATGAALIPHIPAGEARLDLLLACAACFGLSVVASLLTIAALWASLLRHGPGPAARVPTLWIVLGPLGQSITAAALLSDVAPVDARERTVLHGLAVAYGVPVLGFALLWLVLAALLTARTLRGDDGLPFTPAFWAFTFPVGTLVTGTSELAAHTGSAALADLAVALFALLLAAWVTAATATLRAQSPRWPRPTPRRSRAASSSRSPWPWSSGACTAQPMPSD